jgi:hypothetical protein
MTYINGEHGTAVLDSWGKIPGKPNGYLTLYLLPMMQIPFPHMHRRGNNYGFYQPTQIDNRTNDMARVLDLNSLLSPAWMRISSLALGKECTSRGQIVHQVNVNYYSL